MITKLFFDTNVIVDAVTARDYDFADSQKLIIKVAKKEIEGIVCAKQISDIYYILRKYVAGESKKRNILKYICATFKVVPLLSSDIKFCLNSDFVDYEDAIINEVAKINCAHYLVTHDVKHFKKTDLVVISPHDLLTLVEANN